MTGAADQGPHSFELIRNPDGSANLVWDGCALHSRQNPEREARRFAESILNQIPDGKSPAEALLLIGIGWGYHIPHIRELFPGCILYACEPIPEIIQILKESGRFEELGRYGLHWVEDSRSIAQQNSRIVTLPVYARLFPERIDSLLSPSGGIDASTTSRFARIWFRNFFKRVADSKSLPFLTAIRHGAKSPPAALYCGAGPNLLREIAPLAGKKRGPLLVIASDTSLAPLYSCGIRPDIVITMDAGYGTYEHINAYIKAGRFRNGLPRSLPVLTWSGGPSFLEGLNANLLLYPTMFPLDQLIEPIVHLPAWINPSRNQAGIALHIASRAGCSRLFTAGADFVSDSSQTHTGGTGYTLFAMKGLDRTHPIEGYRVRGYAKGLTEKNRGARAGVALLSGELRIPVLAIAGHEDEFRVTAEGEGLDTDFIVKEIPAERIRAHLRENLSRIDYRSLEKGGLSGAEALVRRYSRYMDRAL